MKLFIHYLKNYKWPIALALLLAAINQFFSLTDPLFFGKLIDLYARDPKHGLPFRFSDLFSSKPSGLLQGAPDRPLSVFLWGAFFILLAAITVAMISRIAKAFQDYFVNVIIQRFGAQVYSDGIKHSLRLPYQRFEDQRSGETLSILQKVRTDSEKFITAFFNVLFTSFIGIVFVTIYMLSISWKLTIAYFLGCIILGVLTNLLSRKIKTIQKTIVKETTMLAGATTESLRNIELVKSLGLTHQEIRRLNSTTIKILLLELKKVRSIRSISFVQGTFVNFLRQSLLFFMMYLMFYNSMTVGQLITLQLYSFFIFGPLQELGNIILSYREAQVSLINFQNLLNTPVEKMPEHPVRINNLQTLQFDHVGFQHLTAKTKALDDITFDVKTGETIAFVGPSGSGKTSLVKLLVGLYNPEEGNIRYNSHDSTKIDMEELRHQIGFVTQDTQLFSGSIRENLLYVNPRATDEDIIDVLQKAACQNLMLRGDKGLDTVIGEGGMKISGGEKQRLSIARALLREPRLLVFDEATSALDSITEEEITNTVKSIIRGGQLITVMIAHRLSTILHADRIYVLEKGKIIETGSHASLLEEKGLYYAMWRQQIGERKTEPVPAK